MIFKENINLKENRDTLKEIYNETIRIDYSTNLYAFLYPILSEKDDDTNKNVLAFLQRHRITTNKDITLTNEELLTISYLAPFYKEKIRHNIFEFNKYLFLIGYDVGWYDTLNTTKGILTETAVADDFDSLALDIAVARKKDTLNTKFFNSFLAMEQNFIANITIKVAFCKKFWCFGITHCVDNIRDDGWDVGYGQVRLK